MIIFVFSAMVCSPILLICTGLILSLVTSKLLKGICVDINPELKTESCPFHKTYFRTFIGNNNANDGKRNWKKLKDNSTQRDFTEKAQQFMQTN